MLSQFTSLLRIIRTALLPRLLSGTTVKNEASIPRFARERATLASLPPYLASKVVAVLIFS